MIFKFIKLGKKGNMGTGNVTLEVWRGVGYYNVD